MQPHNVGIRTWYRTYISLSRRCYSLLGRINARGAPLFWNDIQNIYNRERTFVDLDKAYREIALRIAKDHQDVLRLHFAGKELQGSEDQLTETERSSKLEAIDVPDEAPIELYFESTGMHRLDGVAQRANGDNDDGSELVRNAKKSLTQSYWFTRQKRMAIERYRCQEVRVYSEFLRCLYSDVEDVRPVIKEVWRAYLDLPEPRPRHIQPQHLEDLISLFMGPGIRHNQGKGWYLDLMSDLASCGMPISAREAAASLKVVRDFNNIEHELAQKVTSWITSTQELLDVAEQSGDFSQVYNRLDVGTLNIMLGLAHRSGRDDLIASVLRVFERAGIEPDKTTHLVELLDCSRKGDAAGVRAKYADICNGNFVIDMSVINAVMKAFLATGIVEQAESMFRKLVISSFRISASQQIRRSTYRASAKLKSYLDCADYLLRVVQSSSSASMAAEPGLKGTGPLTNMSYFVPLIPDYHSYSMFLNHYCTVVHDYDKSIGVVHLMLEQGLCLDRYVFFSLFKSFALAPSGPTSGWTLERLNYVTNLLCDIQSEHHSEPLCTRIMANYAKQAYARFLDGRANDDYLQELTDPTPSITSSIRKDSRMSSTNRATNPFGVYFQLRKMASSGA